MKTPPSCSLSGAETVLAGSIIQQMPTLNDYRDLVSDRPEKFSAEEVQYRRAEGKERCSRCIHFYERRLDTLGVCEIMRSEETDEKGVLPNWVCDFTTQDGETFPLLQEVQHEAV